MNQKPEKNETTSVYREIGSRIKFYRKVNHITLEKLAKELHKSVSTVH